MDDLLLLLLSSYEPLYFSASLAFENRFARHIIFSFPYLFQRGHINLIMREINFEYFIETKQAQYDYSHEGYNFYFDKTWQNIAAINPCIIHRATDTTKYLEQGIISDLTHDDLIDTGRRLGINSKGKYIYRLAPYIEDSIHERGTKAITKRLFNNVYTQKNVSKNIKTLFNTKISEHYIRSYIEEYEGTIVTGIRSAVDYFSYLCPTFPCHHLPLWRTIYHKVGFLSVLPKLSDFHLITIRESAEFVRFVNAIRSSLEALARTHEIIYSSFPGIWFSENILDKIDTIPNSISGYEEFLLTLKDVTDQLEDFPNNYSNYQKQKERSDMKKNVFVVYGRDKKKRKAIFDLLRSAGLKPMEWDHIVSLTGKGSPYVGEILDKGLDVAQAIVVLFTGDDLAKIDPVLLSEGDSEEYLTPQPRPNVILEAGMALAKNPDRTIIVQIGKIRDISDLTGRHIIHLKDTPESRKQLLDRLHTAGCDTDLVGNDWMTAGEIE